MKELLFIFLYILSSVCATFMVVNANIFKFLRDWASKYTSMLTCSLCAGFWISMINGMWMGLIFAGHIPAGFLAINFALCGSLFSYTFDLFAAKIEMTLPRRFPMPPLTPKKVEMPIQVNPCVDCIEKKPMQQEETPTPKKGEIGEVIPKSVIPNNPTPTQSPEFESFYGGKFGK